VDVSNAEPTNAIDEIFADISAERRRQDEKWGPQRHEWPVWSAILTEETGEVAQACLRALAHGRNAGSSP
jgi:hypothetical protein